MLQCSKCPLSFPSQSEFEAHTNNHKTKLSCQICFKQVTSQYHLDKHMICHSRKLDCPVCGHKSSRTDNLVRHLTLAHKVPKADGLKLLKTRNDPDHQMIMSATTHGSASSATSKMFLANLKLSSLMMTHQKSTGTSQTLTPLAPNPDALTIDQKNMIALLVAMPTADSTSSTSSTSSDNSSSNW